MRPGDADGAYDLVVVGGGITGAGVFSGAVSRGLKTLLVEQQDFAWGTSSRSSKMVHGGLRYLRQGRIFLTRASVRERERLLRAYPGLVTPLDFLLPVYRGRGPSRAAMTAGLNIYSFLAGQRQHRGYDRAQALDRVPGLSSAGLVSAFGFRDAQVDDARLVLRILFDTVDRGGHALNYTAALGITRDRRGRVRGIQIEDRESGLRREIRTPAVVNATGPFAETLHPSPVKQVHIRPLRGSHLIFPGHLMPLDRVVSFAHPEDLRPVFLFPWQGTLVLGTTDVDHCGALADEPAISRKEAAYLVDGASQVFPGRDFSLGGAVSSIAGIRPVLGRGNKSASRESREHMIWTDRGLVTVTGGKLTTFRLLAKDALKAAAPWLPCPDTLNPRSAAQLPGRISPGMAGLLRDAGEGTALRLQGRLGQRVLDFGDLITPENSRLIPGTHTCWGELSYGAAREEVMHLADLLLRRVRIGLLLPRGGMGLMDEIRRRTAPFLDWDSRRWEDEISAYKRQWEQAHSPERCRT